MTIQKDALGMTMQINEEFINNLATQLVSESVMATIGGGDKFVKQIVSEILNTKVDESGNVRTYGERTYLKWLIEKVIREEIESVLTETINEKRKDIKEVVRRELMKKDTIDKFFNAFTESVSGGLKKYWKAKIDVSFIEPE